MSTIELALLLPSLVGGERFGCTLETTAFPGLLLGLEPEESKARLLQTRTNGISKLPANHKQHKCALARQRPKVICLKGLDCRLGTRHAASFCKEASCVVTSRSSLSLELSCHFF